jgi:hypothetical protein
MAQQLHPNSLWKNGHLDSFSGKLRDELLNLEVFDALLEVKAVVKRRRRHCERIGPPSGLGCRPPTPVAVLPWRPSLEAMPLQSVGLAQLLVTLRGWAEGRGDLRARETSYGDSGPTHR